MIDKIYHFFLYYMGFPTKPSEVGVGGEHITDMLQRQKERFGKLWWVTIIGWGLFANLFYIWLLLHVIGIKPWGVARRKHDE